MDPNEFAIVYVLTITILQRVTCPIERDKTTQDGPRKVFSYLLCVNGRPVITWIEL